MPGAIASCSERNGEKLLTSREEQVVALVADGLSNRNVATELGLSEHTVKEYLFRIFEKLGISNAWNSCCMQCITAGCSRAPV